MSEMRDAFERKMKELYPNTDIGEKWGATYRTPNIDAMWRGFMMAWKPVTHKAVVDDRGEVFLARPDSWFCDAEKECSGFLQTHLDYDGTRAMAEKWKIKNMILLGEA